MKPSPYQIAAFTEVARHRSFSKAAQVLEVTQSSVTQHVAKLEKNMGAQLFVRRRDGLDLTRAGRELFDVADRWRSLDQLVDETVNSYANVESGSLRVVANAARPAMQVIQQFLSAYPRVQIEFMLASWQLTMQKLKNRDVDVAFIVEPDPLENLIIHELQETKFAAFVHRSHPMASKKVIAFKEVEDQTIIVPEDGSMTQRLIQELIEKTKVRPKRIIQVATFPVVKEAVLHQVGIGFMLTDALYPSSNLRKIDVRELDRSYRHCLAIPSERQDIRIIKSFQEIAFEMSKL